MKVKFLVLLPVVFGVIAGDYVGPQNGFRNGNGNGNGNGNSYGVPPDSITPPQPQGGPYPPSGWKPAGRRLLLPGESRSADQPIGNGFAPPPSQYGPVNPAPSGPSGPSGPSNQYGPSVDSTGPPNNQYIPGSGFGNGGNGNGNGHNGNGNGHGNGHNGNGNGNGHGNGNGNGVTGGNGFGNGNGHNGNGNGHNGNGNGHNGNGNGGNGFSNGNGNGNGHNGNGFSNGNGNGGNGNGNKGGNGANGLTPAFHGAFPGGVIYPFIQHSVPAVLAFRPSNGAGHGSIYPLYQVPITPSQSGTGIIASAIPTDQGALPVGGANPTFQIASGAPDLGAVYPGFQITGAHDLAGTQPAVIGQGGGLAGHGIGQYYTLLSSNHLSQKQNILGLRNGLTNLQLQYAVGNSAAYGTGVPLGVF